MKEKADGYLMIINVEVESYINDSRIIFVLFQLK